MKLNQRLTAAAMLENEDFIAVYGDSSCSCHVSPPCAYCVHPGNTKNLGNDESNWEECDCILFFDTETTGLPEFEKPSEDPCQPHIVQLAGVLAAIDTREVLAEVCVLVKPEGYSWDATSKAFQTHGITMDRALAEGIPEKDAIQKLLDLWESAKIKVGHNVSFDNRIIRIGLKRYFNEELAERFKASPSECTGLLAKPIMKMEPKTKWGYKMPKLIEAFKHFTGTELTGAHDAMNDTQACATVYWALRELETAKAPA